MASQTSVLAEMNRFSRSGSVFENPNNFGMFLLLPLLIGTSLLLNVKFNMFSKLILLLILGLCGFALIGTFSRASWISLIIGFLIVYNYSKNKIYINFALLVILVIFFIGVVQSPILQGFLIRFGSIFESTLEHSASTRVFLIIGGVKMFLNSYFIGVGFRGFMVEYYKYMPESQTLTNVFHSHTLPVEVLAELGIAGFILFWAIFIGYFRFGFRTIKTIKDNFLKACQMKYKQCK